MDTSIIYKDDAYKIIGKCLEVHKALGHGFLEIVYKDALEIAFKQDGISYAREKEYGLWFRDTLLPHKYHADFVILDKITLEVKCATSFTDSHLAQTINYLKASGNRLGLLVNFGRASLEYKRLVL